MGGGIEKKFRQRIQRIAISEIERNGRQADQFEFYACANVIGTKVIGRCVTGHTADAVKQTLPVFEITLGHFLNGQLRFFPGRFLE